MGRVGVETWLLPRNKRSSLGPVCCSRFLRNLFLPRSRPHGVVFYSAHGTFSRRPRDTLLSLLGLLSFPPAFRVYCKRESTWVEKCHLWLTLDPAKELSDRVCCLPFWPENHWPRSLSAPPQYTRSMLLYTLINLPLKFSKSTHPSSWSEPVLFVRRYVLSKQKGGRPGRWPSPPTPLQ